MKPTNVTLRLRIASMSQEATAALVFPASTVLLVADLATVTTEADVSSCFVHICLYYCNQSTGTQRVQTHANFDI